MLELMDMTPYERNGLILTRDAIAAGVSYRDLAREVESGQLLRLRRGAYVPTVAWNESSKLQRHLIRITGVVALAEHPVILACESAAALWGVPLDEFPVEVTVLDAWRGGGRSEPGVRRTSRGARTAETVRRGGFECTTLARTILQVTRELPFSRAVPLLDWALSPRNPQPLRREELVIEAKRIGCTQRQWLAIGFADARSGSIGESEARAVFRGLGFPDPDLQRRFADEQGEFFPDFYWEQFNVAGEFDGKEKYARAKYTHGDPAEVVWREKKREDRLRRHVRTVVRVLTSDVKQPSVLAAKLLGAGIHRLGSGPRPVRSNRGGGS